MTKKKILIVEDNHAVSNIYKKICEAKFDVEVDIVYTGNDATNYIELNSPDMVFCDLMLPDMSGYEVLKKVKEDIILQNVPVIIVSAVAGDVDHMGNDLSQADDSLLKPVSQEQMLGVLKKYLG